MQHPQTIVLEGRERIVAGVNILRAMARGFGWLLTLGVGAGVGFLAFQLSGSSVHPGSVGAAVCAAFLAMALFRLIRWIRYVGRWFFDNNSILFDESRWDLHGLTPTRERPAQLTFDAAACTVVSEGRTAHVLWKDILLGPQIEHRVFVQLPTSLVMLEVGDSRGLFSALVALHKQAGGPSMWTSHFRERPVEIRRWAADGIFAQ